MSRSHPQDEKVVCVSCGFANYPKAKFCVECEAPISAHTVNDPFDTIETTGWAYRKAQESPRLIVVVGVWLLFLPMGIACCVGIYTWVSELLFRPRPRNAGEQFGMYLLAPALLGIGSYISITILRRTTRGYLAARVRSPSVDEDDSDDDDLDDGGNFDDDDPEDDSDR